MWCQLKQKWEQNKTEMQREFYFYFCINTGVNSLQQLNNNFIADCQISDGRYVCVFLLC